MKTHGSCLCGAVSFEVEGPLRPVIACHCQQCRKTSGHHVAATAAPKNAISTQGANEIQWFAASDTARRAFCGTCGSHLFWDQHGSDMMSIFAGTLDGETGLAIHSHIFCADKGDYYELDDAAPKYAGSSDSEPHP
jgi:hypothetical protein